MAYLQLLLALLTILGPLSLTNAATITVAPGQSVQAALNRAQSGDIVHLSLGHHAERVTIPRDGITLQGAGAGTILDGSEPTSGWVSVGNGIWRASLGNPQALFSDGKTIWMITDKNMQNGSGMNALRQSHDAKARPGNWGEIQWWDGQEALFGNSGGQTYLRFRDGANPTSRNVRAAPAGGVITVAGQDNVTLRNLTVRGGQFAVEITGGSRNTVIEQTVLLGGKNRIALHNGGGHGTVIRKNTLRLEGIGQQQFPPGARNNTSYGRIVNLHAYGQNKFLHGDTETNDASIVIAGGSSNVLVEDNEISHGQMGIVLYQVARDVRIVNNRFHHFNDIGIYMNADLTTLQVAGNLFYDSTHHMRMESMDRAHQIHIYANRFHNPLASDSSKGPGKHVFIPPPRGTTSPAQVWVYHNSFAGGGYAVDMGGTNEGRRFSYPQLHVRNNVFSSTGISSGGTGVIGDFKDNLAQSLWPGESVPNFQLPAALRDRAPRLDWPGITDAYIGDGRPDHGALQAGGSSTVPSEPGPAPSPPVAARPPAPRNLQFITRP